MAAAAQYEGLLAPLSAYHSLLRQCVEPPSMETDRPHDILWLKPKNKQRVTCEMLTAMELFALLAHVDWELWKSQAKQIWVGYALEDLRGQPVRVGVELDLNVDSGVEPVLEILDTTAQWSADVVRAREEAQRLLHGRGKVLTDMPMRVARFGLDADLNSVMPKVMRILAAQELLDGQDTNENRYRGLQLRSFRPNLAYIALSAPDLQQLAAIAEAGVAVDDFGTITPEAHLHNPDISIKALWTLFAIGATNGLARVRGVKKVALLVKKFDAGLIPSIYSAIGASSSVHSMALNLTIHDTTASELAKQAMQWIGFSLFCRAPINAHKIQALTLNVKNFKVEDVELMRDVVSAQDPITKLFPRAALLATEAISASRFVLRDPTKNNRADRVSVESPNVLTDLPVLEKTPEWTSVLLPAWGQAWAHQDDIVATHCWAPGPFPVKSIARVEFTNLSDQSKDAVMALLRLIGAGITHLIIKADTVLDQTSFDGWLTQAIDLCPSLEMLELDRVPLHSLQFLLDGYESGKCRLTRFKTAGKMMSAAEESLCRLFAALGDQTHPAARYLSELRCSPVKIASLSDPVMVATAVGMLEKNQRLRDLELGFVWSVTTFEERTEPLRAFDKKKISRALAPLDAYQRLAFLSVVAPYQDRKGLDSDVIVLILEMAAECCERRVHLQMASTW